MEFSAEETVRIEQTVRVTDTEDIPKVEGAGEVLEHRGVRVQRMHDGLLVEADGYGGAWQTEIIRRLRGHHEPQEEPVFHAMIERLREAGGAPTMIELGAYWSYYSMWFKHALPAGRCVMVEPDPENLALGRRNFALNDLQGDFVHAAVGRHRRRIRMVTEHAADPKWVRTVSVDGLLADRGLERVDLLLVDVQGAELTALRGAREAIARGAVRFVVLSTHHEHISGDALLHHRCLEFLREAGAHVIAEHGIYESCSGDGLIAASFDPADRDLQVALTTVRARDSLAGEPEFELAAARARIEHLERVTGLSAARWVRHWGGELVNVARRARR